jgi:osmoprotectant transport system ATP-binding protein
MRVRDNIAVVPKLLKWDKARTRRRVNDLLDLVGLPADRYGARYPSQLSGGEQQRVGLARALAAEPGTMLMDEPFGALDAITRGRLQVELKRIHRQLRHTILFVTHDVDEAVRLADRIVVMRHGRVEQVGTPLDIVSEPATPFVSDLAGSQDAVRKMTLMPIAAAVQPLTGEAGDASNALSLDATLRDALNALVAANADRLPVRDLDNLIIGEVTMASLREATAGATTHAQSAPIAAE